VKTHLCQQATEEWFKLRCGVATASEFDNLVTPEWKIRTGATPETYLLKKLAERHLGSPQLSYSSGAMEQGVLREDEARAWYEFNRSAQVERVGFCTTDDGKAGCSPDGLVGEDGGLEIKCPEAHTHLRYLMAGVLPKDYAAQVQGSLFITGRKWWDFLSYNRSFPALVVRVTPDPVAQEAIGKALGQFTAALDTAFIHLQTLAEKTA